MSEERFVVLLAEDDEHDVVATRRAWKELGIPNPLRVVSDGEECLDYLLHRGKYLDSDSAPRPGIILLDVNMPRQDGIETLRRIRASAETGNLPVIMLTTSRLEEDRIRSYDLGANAYIVKPVGFGNFVAAVRTIHEFWKLVELPGVRHGTE